MTMSSPGRSTAAVTAAGIALVVAGFVAAFELTPAGGQPSPPQSLDRTASLKSLPGQFVTLRHRLGGVPPIPLLAGTPGRTSATESQPLSSPPTTTFFQATTYFNGG